MGAAERRCEQHLEHQFVARRWSVGGRELPPPREPLPARRRELIPLAVRLALTVGTRARDQTVTGESVEGRVHLPDVERPHSTGRGLELDLQLMTIARAVREQREQSLSHRHIRSIYIL